MTAYFVDPSAGNDSNDGLDNIGLGLATATWTASSLTLTQAGAFSSYTYVEGHMIAITGGTGATTGLYQVASKVDANSITLVATTSVPGAKNGATLSGSDLATGDITSSSGPVLTMAQADTNMSTGDRLWMKGSATYAYAGVSMITWTTHSSTLSGYSAIPGDGGRVLFDGTVNSNTYIFNPGAVTTWKLENAIINGGSYSIWTNTAYGTLRNCVLKGFSVRGLTQSTSYSIVEGCEFATSSGVGAISGLLTFFRRSYFHDLGTGVLAGTYGAIYSGCVFDTCTIGVDQSIHSNLRVYDSTFYGCSTAGVQHSNSAVSIDDSVFSGCGYGVDNDGSTAFVTGGANSVRGNHWHSNTTNIGSSGGGSWLTVDGEDPSTVNGSTSGDPLFADAPNGDFSLGAGSPARDASYEFVSTEVSSSSTTHYDKGAIQAEAAGGGGIAQTLHTIEAGISA